MEVRLRCPGAPAGTPVRFRLDLDEHDTPGWIDPDSWVATQDGAAVPLHVETDTLDGRRFTLRFVVAGAGNAEIVATAVLRDGARGAPATPPARVVPLIGAGEALTLGSTGATGDLHVGLQTTVDVVDWFGRGRRDLLLCCLGHEGGAFVYAATDDLDGAGRPIFRRAGRVPGFGDDGHSYNGKVRAVDLRGDGRFDLLECRGRLVRWHRNTGAVGAPRFDPPQSLAAGGAPFDLGARSQMVAPVSLGDGLVSLLVGTNDWSEYWPRDVGAWDDSPGYRPYDAAGVWRGGPLRGFVYLLRNVGTRDAPAFAAPEPLCHDDGTPIEVYGLADPTVLPPARPDGGFDLVVSDFLDRLWYFQSTGASGPGGVPRFAPRTPVRSTGEPAPPIDRTPGPPPPAPTDYAPADRLADEAVLPTCMHTVTAVRWPAPAGGEDLLVGAEDGYIRALRVHARTAEGVPVVGAPGRLQEVGARLCVGAKACPTVVDWDGQGRSDLLIGNAAGQVLLSRDTGTPGTPGTPEPPVPSGTPGTPEPPVPSGTPVYGAPQPLPAPDRPLWLMAGPPGTMQGPSEVKWGYVNPAVGTWPAPSGAGGRAIVCGDALGHNTLYLAPGPGARVTRGRRLHVLRDGRWAPLVTRWRCRPQLVDWGNGETVYLQVDEAGALRCYRILPDGPAAEDGEVHVAPLDALRHAGGDLVRLDSDDGGRIGRLKLAVADWDGDGLPDLLVGGSGSQPHGVNTYRKATVWLLRNAGRPGQPQFDRPAVVPLDAGQVAAFGGHSCVPAPCRLGPVAGARGHQGMTGAGASGQLDLLVGSENGRIYAYRRSYVESAPVVQARIVR